MRFSILTILITAVSCQTTSIHFGMDVHCQIFSNWCVTLNVIELNTFFPNTAVVTAGPKCLDHRGSLALNTNGEISGDGWFDNRFEFMGQVIHNCTRNGENMMFHLRLGYYPDYLKEIRRKFHVNINEKGRVV